VEIIISTKAYRKADLPHLLVPNRTLSFTTEPACILNRWRAVERYHAETTNHSRKGYVMRNVLMVFLALLLVPAVVTAMDADKLIITKMAPSSSELIISLEVVNNTGLTALDIPLEFTEGAILDKVEFMDRVKGFEFQVANIDNDNHQVVIGLVSMVTGDRPDLAAGEGAIANLHFRLNGRTSELEISPIELENPSHELAFYSNDYSTGVPELKVVHPEVVNASYSGSSIAVPEKFGLSQNYPNPFNPSTKISYNVPGTERQMVNLSVYNVLGQTVATLVDEPIEPGTHEAIWNANNVASGVYFYQLRIGNQVTTKKMELLK